MAVIAKTSSDFENVKRIASYCEAVDPSWYEGLKESGETTEVVKGCQARLNKLAPSVHRCCAVIFGKIRFREQTKDDRESVSSKSFTIHHSKFERVNDLEKMSGPIDIKVMPPDTEVADFVLLWGKKILRIKLDPESNQPLILGHDPSSLWDVSSSTIKKMTDQIWNGSFVTAAYSRTDVVRIPSVVDSEMKK